MKKMFVCVLAETYVDGSVYPKKIIWEDGRTWDITRVIHVSEPAENEYEGIRYLVKIGSAEKYIYRIGTQWYVEPNEVEGDTS